LFFSPDVDAAIREAELIFVSVGTPTKPGGLGAGMAADLGYVTHGLRLTHCRAVEAATRHIALTSQTSKIIVEKSTVPCRTAQSMRVILEANARPGVHFDILSNPEFLAEVLSFGF
jgi:UDPglucose 6-dehydrogenase